MTIYCDYITKGEISIVAQNSHTVPSAAVRQFNCKTGFLNKLSAWEMKEFKQTFFFLALQQIKQAKHITQVKDNRDSTPDTPDVIL